MSRRLPLCSPQTESPLPSPASCPTPPREKASERAESQGTSALAMPGSVTAAFHVLSPSTSSPRAQGQADGMAGFLTPGATESLI